MKRFVEDDTIPHLHTASSEWPKTVCSDTRPWLSEHLEDVLLYGLICVIFGVVLFYLVVGL